MCSSGQDNRTSLGDSNEGGWNLENQKIHTSMLIVTIREGEERRISIKRGCPGGEQRVCNLERRKHEDKLCQTLN